MKFLVIASAFAALVTGQATWKDCSTTGSHASIQNIKISPAQPVKGQPFNIDGSGTVDKATTSTAYQLKIALNGIPVFSHKGDGCHPDTINLPLGMGTIKLGGATCPIAKGASVALTQTVEVAKASPNGKFVSTFSTTDQDGEPDFCVEISFTMQDGQMVEERMPLPSVMPLTVTMDKDFLMRMGVNGHYGDPKDGCGSDEQAVQVQGVPGDFCSPACTAGVCPKDVPTGVTAKPECALQTTTGSKYCALICSPSLPIMNQMVADAQCGTNASCKPISGVGLCTYDD